MNENAKKTRALALLLPPLLLLLAAAQVWSEGGGGGEPQSITLASTTSTRDSGLLAHLLGRFEAASGIAVRVIAVGTGQALELGRRGDVDVLLVHDRRSEEALVAEGHARYRRGVMYNDFVIAGPRADPAGAARAPSAAAAFAQIAARRSPFVSRGDESGTHKAERRLWRSAGVRVAAAPRWYRETGSGMGAALNIARELGAYVLVDRGTWLALREPGALALLFEGDAALHNPYGVLPINPALHPHVKAALAERFAQWLLSDAGQRAIDSFRIDGRQLFFAQRGQRGRGGE